MARCYLTGVEFRIFNGFVLNPAAANRALRNLRRKIVAIQRLIDQLAQCDVVEIPHKPLKKNIPHRHRRLVCQSVAEALAAACPEENLFLSWHEYRCRLFTPHYNEPALVTKEEGDA